MNFDFSEDQKFLAGEARKFLEAESAIPVVREVLNDVAIINRVVLRVEVV